GNARIIDFHFRQLAMRVRTMAEPIKYNAKADAPDLAQAELQQLLRILYQSGTLRALTGVLGSVPGIAEVILKHLETDAGRRLSSNLAIAATALSAFDHRVIERAAFGVAEGTRAAASSAQERPPGFFRLLWSLRSHDARRGLHALVIILQA